MLMAAAFSGGNYVAKFTGGALDLAPAAGDAARRCEA